MFLNYKIYIIEYYAQIRNPSNVFWSKFSILTIPNIISFAYVYEQIRQ